MSLSCHFFFVMIYILCHDLHDLHFYINFSYRIIMRGLSFKEENVIKDIRNIFRI